MLWLCATVAYAPRSGAQPLARVSKSALVARPMGNAVPNFIDSTVGSPQPLLGRTRNDARVVFQTERTDRNHSAPWWAPVASALLPGTGQFALGQQRSIAYAVSEAYLWVQLGAAQKDSKRAVNDYRQLASDVARRGFGTNHPAGPWDYYETMEHEEYIASGVFDRIAGGAVDPETDITTFNGASWLLARQLNWADPDVAPAISSAAYQSALTFYVDRAVRDDYRWTWRDAQLQRDIYRQTIASANRSEKRATAIRGLIVTNHLTSLIDAYVTVRIRRYGGVRVAGFELDGIRTAVAAAGDPADRNREISGAIQLSWDRLH